TSAGAQRWNSSEHIAASSAGDAEERHSRATGPHQRRSVEPQPAIAKAKRRSSSEHVATSPAGNGEDRRTRATASPERQRSVEPHPAATVWYAARRSIGGACDSKGSTSATTEPGRSES